MDFSFNSGAWTIGNNAPYYDLDFEGWGLGWATWPYSTTDWESEIQSQGHPSWPLIHELADSTNIPDSVCTSAASPASGNIAFAEGGIGFLMQYFFGWPWGECWLVTEGPVTSFIDVTVKDASTLIPVAWVDVSLTGAFYTYSAFANSQGQVTVEVLPDTYDVEAKRCDYYANSESVRANPGTTTSVTVLLTKRPLGKPRRRRRSASV